MTSIEGPGTDPGARQLGEPRGGRAIGIPREPVDTEIGGGTNVFAFIGEPDPVQERRAPQRPVIAASDGQAAASQDTGSSQSSGQSGGSSATTTNSGNAAGANDTTASIIRSTRRTTTTVVADRVTTTTAARRQTTTTETPATSTTARRNATTTSIQRTTTTKATTTTTTTRPPTTTTTVAPPPTGGPGCQSNCTTVGFQDLRNKSGVTLQNLIISNPNGRCIDLTGAKDITIRNVTIQTCGTNAAINGGYDAGLIHIENASNITISNSIIENMSAERFGGSRNNAIQIRSSRNVSITNNVIRNVHSNIGDKGNDRGNRAIKIEGSTSHVKIDANRFQNAGRNAVQISRVRNAPGMSITNNVIEGRSRWDSDYEDMINLYSASGTPQDPIRISQNTMRNGGPSTSGTGIILGDGNASVGPTEHVVAEGNRLIDPGHVGINLAGGNNLTVRNNVIVGRGDVPHKTTTGFTINHFGYSHECKNHTVTGNRVWMDNQHLGAGVNHTWIPGTCTNNVRIEGNVFGDATLR